jgi:hypothetical protein
MASDAVPPLTCLTRKGDRLVITIGTVSPNFAPLHEDEGAMSSDTKYIDKTVLRSTRV